MLIDSHCHLNYKGLVESQQDVLARARERGVKGFLNISTRQREWADIVSTAHREDDIWASIGRSDLVTSDRRLRPLASS